MINTVQKDFIIPEDAFNKKEYYKIEEKDKDTYSFGHFEEYENEDLDNALTGLGQIALNNGCDIFLFRDKYYLAESHGGNDFMSKNYMEECDYCYSVSELGI